MIDSLTIAENERRFVAQELHDNIAQTLLQMNLQLAICKRYQEIGNTREVEAELNNLERQIHIASQQARELIADLRPPLSDDGSFESTLQKQIEIHNQRGGPPVTLQKPETIILTGVTKLAVARIIQETLLNIRKHAQASTVNITFNIEDTGLTLTVSDNGVGFDDALVPNPLAEKGGAGIINMDIRANAIGGQLHIKSSLGGGSVIQVTGIPV